MFIEMEIKTVVIGGGPVSSLIVLQPTQQNEDEPLNLPIRIGSVEATDTKNTNGTITSMKRINKKLTLLMPLSKAVVARCPTRLFAIVPR